MEDEIKKMKQTKKDILEIHPILQEKTRKRQRHRGRIVRFRKCLQNFTDGNVVWRLSEETRDMLLKLCEEEEPHETD